MEMGNNLKLMVVMEWGLILLILLMEIIIYWWIISFNSYSNSNYSNYFINNKGYRYSKCKIRKNWGNNQRFKKCRFYKNKIQILVVKVKKIKLKKFDNIFLRYFKIK